MKPFIRSKKSFHTEGNLLQESITSVPAQNIQEPTLKDLVNCLNLVTKKLE